MGGAESVVRNTDKRTSRREHRETFEASIARFRAAPFDTPSQPVKGNAATTSTRSIRVCVRKRPLFAHEQKQGEFDVVSCLPRRVVIHDARMKSDMRHMVMNHIDFEFDDVFADTADNQAVYDDAVKELVLLAAQGGNATLMMYGQTGSGKTYTMSSIYERMAGDLFAQAEGSRTITVSFIELLGDSCFDVLNSGSACNLVTGGDGSVHPFPSVEVPVTNAAELQALFEMAAKMRATAATGVNDQSSRSHALCRVFIQDAGAAVDDPSHEGSLTLVDLAGTENRIDNAEHNAERQKEGARINASLAALKECVRATAGGAKFVAYRRNRLTQLLRGCFAEGHSTVIIATVSPSSKDTEQSLNTLRHACIMDGQGEAQSTKSTHITGGVLTKEELGEINVTKIAREQQAAKRRLGQATGTVERSAPEESRMKPTSSSSGKRSQVERKNQQALPPDLLKALLAARAGTYTADRQRARISRNQATGYVDQANPNEAEQADRSSAPLQQQAQVDRFADPDFQAEVETCDLHPSQGEEQHLAHQPEDHEQTGWPKPGWMDTPKSEKLHDHEQGSPGAPAAADARSCSSCSTRSPQDGKESQALLPQEQADAEVGLDDAVHKSSSGKKPHAEKSRFQAVEPQPPPPPPSSSAEGRNNAVVVTDTRYTDRDEGTAIAPRHRLARSPVRQAPAAAAPAANVGAGTVELRPASHEYDQVQDGHCEIPQSAGPEHSPERSAQDPRGKALSLFRCFCRSGRDARAWTKTELRLINTHVVPELFGNFHLDWAHPNMALDQLDRL
eukprot:CAMPEP_0178382306 /NCGR_PEP_ID=MMETSP0689_2-20121128/6426_1 /TAXON_ID=160604 /ORGANISM="Amphidinium massartii, Strain CS-259" /LENGTH=790 /DNA_ID=CAMNT_0020002507 /DNA_START=19 /DNA_END=2388 /DNA_ORIENTATION=-